MSLIADSLKNALKEKPSKSEVNPEINLLARDPVLGDSKKPLVLKIVFMVVVPAAILAYLIFHGSFDNRGTWIAKLPIWKSFGTAKQKPSFTPPPVVNSPAREQADSSGEKAQAEKAPVVPLKKEEKSVVEKKALPSASQSAPPVTAKSPVRGKKISPESRAQTEKLSPVPMEEKETAVKVETPAIQSAAAPPSSAQKRVPVLEEMQSEPEAPVSPEEGTSEAKPPATVKPKPKKAQAKKPPAKKSAKAAPPKTDSMEEPPQEARAIPPAGKPKPALPQAPGPDNILKNSDYYFNRGIFFQQAGDSDKALANYRDALKANPNNPDIFNNMGVVYKDLGKYDEAIDELLKAVYTDPNYAKAYNNIGVVYYLKKNYQGAVSNYEKAIEIKPNNVEAYNNLAVVYKKLNQREKAKSILNKALSIDPNHAGTNYNLALLYEEEGAAKSAIHFYRRFVELGEISHPALVAEVNAHLQTLQ